MPTWWVYIHLINLFVWISPIEPGWFERFLRNRGPKGDSLWIDSAVHGFLYHRFVIRTDSAVRRSLHPLFYSDQIVGPWVPAFSFKNLDRFGRPWIYVSVFKTRTDSAVRGSLHFPLKIRSNRRSVDFSVEVETRIKVRSRVELKEVQITGGCICIRK